MFEHVLNLTDKVDEVEGGVVLARCQAGQALESPRRHSSRHEGISRPMKTHPKHSIDAWTV